MAQEYAGQPVVFIEQDVDNSLGDRKSRWWQAYFAAGNSGSTALPLAMADSGNQVADTTALFPGVTTEKFHDLYKGMIEEELARPPLATIEAQSERVGDVMKVTAQVTISSQAGPSYIKDAYVGAIIYEESHILLTERFVRAAVDTYVYPSLQPGGTAFFTLETEPLSGVDWNNLHTIVYVESEPESNDDFVAYDMLQATVAQPATLIIHPTQITVMIGSNDVGNLSIPLSLWGPESTWFATENAPWLTVTPLTGSIDLSPVVTIIRDQLTGGWQEGLISFTADSEGGLHFKEEVLVKVHYGPLERIFFPLVIR